MKNAGHLDLSKGLLKKKVKVLSLNSESAEISQTDWQQIPDRWSDETEKILAKTFQTAFRDF